jgi:hypothetical protein
MIQPRYIIDRVGDEDWQIFDTRVQGTPTIYLLYVAKVESVLANYQLILTVYDGAEAAFATCPELQTELYSMHFYSSTGVDELVDQVFDVLNSVTDIDYPLELAIAFGGFVKSKNVVSAKMKEAH